jgi:hypothetical protein
MSFQWGIGSPLAPSPKSGLNSFHSMAVLKSSTRPEWTAARIAARISSTFAGSFPLTGASAPAAIGGVKGLSFSCANAALAEVSQWTRETADITNTKRGAARRRA